MGALFFRNRWPVSLLTGEHRRKVKIVAEVDSPHFRVVAQRLGRPRSKDAATADDVSPIGDRQGLTNVVIGYQNADPLAFQVSDDTLQFQDLNRIDARERLVEQNEIGL